MSSEGNEAPAMDAQASEQLVVADEAGEPTRGTPWSALDAHVLVANLREIDARHDVAHSDAQQRVLRLDEPPETRLRLGRFDDFLDVKQSSSCRGAPSRA